MVFCSGFLLLFEPVLFQTRQRRYAWIGCVTFTAAFLVVQIHPALGTQAAAIAAADRLHRQSQEDLFGENIGQEHSFSFKKRNFRVVQFQTLLFFLSHGRKRLVEEVKFARNILVDGFQAAGADHFQTCMQLTSYADLAFYQLRGGAHLERLRLAEVSSTVIDRSRRIALPDADFADGQLFYVKEHG
jgi:hypothetical protein